eukprot:gene11579-biopygen820
MYEDVPCKNETLGLLRSTCVSCGIPNRQPVLLRLIRNLAADPGSARYRSVRSSNPAVAGALATPSAAQASQSRWRTYGGLGGLAGWLADLAGVPGGPESGKLWRILMDPGGLGWPQPGLPRLPCVTAIPVTSISQPIVTQFAGHNQWVSVQSGLPVELGSVS